MKKVVVPSFIHNLENLETLPIDSYGLTTELHLKGINIRHLGIIYDRTRLPHVRDLCLVEMIARVVKQLFREELRSAMARLRVLGATHTDNELKSFTVQYFNQALGNSEQQQIYMKNVVKPLLLDKFMCDISIDSLYSINKMMLFQAMQYHVRNSVQDLLTLID